MLLSLLYVFGLFQHFWPFHWISNIFWQFLDINNIIWPPNIFWRFPRSSDIFIFLTYSTFWDHCVQHFLTFLDVSNIFGLFQQFQIFWDLFYNYLTLLDVSIIIWHFWHFWHFPTFFDIICRFLTFSHFNVSLLSDIFRRFLIFS